MNIIWLISREILAWPFWWYYYGWSFWMKYWGRWLKKQGHSLALLVWIKNIFVPMYGQRDIWSFIISFVVRLVQIIVRLAIWLICVAVTVIAIILWPLAPLMIFYYLYILYYGGRK